MKAKKGISYWVRMILWVIWGWQMPLLVKLGLAKYPEPEKVIRCTRCHAEYTEVQFKEMECCTSCGSTAQPQLIEQDVFIRINWQELRVLVEFALRAPVRGESKGLLEEIVRRLASNRPPNAPPLTLEEEYRQRG
jgi:hypothetical protein